MRLERQRVIDQLDVLQEALITENVLSETEQINHALLDDADLLERYSQSGLLETDLPGINPEDVDLV